jgi:hypothetical protein
MTTQAQHTPGPWQYYIDNGASGTHFHIESLNVHGKRQHGLAVIVPNDTASTMLTMEQHRANARLIAAAPELLQIAKAYRNLLKTMAHTDGEVATFEHIELVIAKATA